MTLLLLKLAKLLLFAVLVRHRDILRKWSCAPPPPRRRRRRPNVGVAPAPFS